MRRSQSQARRSKIRDPIRVGKKTNRCARESERGIYRFPPAESKSGRVAGNSGEKRVFRQVKGLVNYRTQVYAQSLHKTRSLCEHSGCAREQA